MVWRAANGYILQLCLLKIVKIEIIFLKDFICLAMGLNNMDMFSNVSFCGGMADPALHTRVPSSLPDTK